MPVPEKGLKSLLGVIQIVTYYFEKSCFMPIETSEPFQELEMWINSEQWLHSKLEKIVPEGKIKVKSSFLALKNKEIAHGVCYSWATVGTIFPLEDTSVVYWSKALTPTQAEVCSERGIICCCICCYTAEVTAIGIYGDTATAETEPESLERCSDKLLVLLSHVFGT